MVDGVELCDEGLHVLQESLPEETDTETRLYRKAHGVKCLVLCYALSRSETYSVNTE